MKLLRAGIVAVVVVSGRSVIVQERLDSVAIIAI
jgi:hypothetical protein